MYMSSSITINTMNCVTSYMPMERVSVLITLHLFSFGVFFIHHFFRVSKEFRGIDKSPFHTRFLNDGRSWGMKSRLCIKISNLRHVKWIRAMKSTWTRVINNRYHNLLQKSQPCLELPRSVVRNDTRLWKGLKLQMCLRP